MDNSYYERITCTWAHSWHLGASSIGIEAIGIGPIGIGG